MARINEYNQSPLASSAVGTPGVDTSPTKIAQALGSVAEKGIDVALKKKQIRDITSATKRSSEFDFESEKLRAEISQNSKGMTADEEASLTESSLEKLRQEYSKTIDSDQERALFNSEAYKAISNRKLKAYEQGNKRMSYEISNNVIENANSLAGGVSNYFQDRNNTPQDKVNAFEMAKQKMVETVDTAKLIYGEAEHAKLRTETPKMLAKGAILGQMQSSPDDAIRLIESGIFNGTLSQTELQSYKSKAETFKIRQAALAEQADKLAKRDTLLSFTDKLVKGELKDGGLAKLEEEVTAGRILPEAAGIFETALFNPDQWELTAIDPKTSLSNTGRVIVNLLRKLDPNKMLPEKEGEKSERDIFSETLIEAVNAYNNKDINKNDLAWILHTANEAINKNPDNPFSDWMKQAVDMVSNYGGMAAVPQFMARMVEGKDPREVAKQVIGEQQKARNPKLNLYDQTPASIVDAFGLVKRLWLGEDAYYENQDNQADGEDSNA